MKTTTLVAVALIGLAGLAQAEMVSVVQITDMRGQVGYQVMTREEYSALMKEIREETAAFAPAVAESKKEWEADKDNKIPFQGGRVKLRSAKKVGADFNSADKAEKKRSQLEERASDKQIEELDKKTKVPNAKEEDIAKDEARVKAFDTAFSMISKKMGDKLGRPVPSFGFAMDEPKKEEKKEELKKDGPKKEEPKKDGLKKEEPKKDGLKKEEPKNEEKKIK